MTSAPPEHQSLPPEAPGFARHLQHQGRNRGGADVLGVQAWEKTSSSWWRALPAASRCWMFGPQHRALKPR
eukprot:10717570-Alexandrium_andersonii.AAC.1